jgi:hypothetical protein
MLTIACVRSGTKYGLDYVERLRDAVARNLDRPHRIVCLTDQMTVPHGVEMVNVAGYGLPGWWAKMALFAGPWRRELGRVLYFDLDTIICGDLAPLADWAGEFGICESFTRLAGHRAWPCAYGSAVMSIAPDWGRDLWDEFWRTREHMMLDCPRGDQQAIEAIAMTLGLEVKLLQREFPAGYFLGYRDLERHRHEQPAEAAVICFGGRSKPHNCGVLWARRAWGLASRGEQCR